MERAPSPIFPRGLRQDAVDSRTKLAQRIAPGSVVLDLGCGAGALGLELTRHKQCVFDGVELDPKSATLAQAHYRHVVVADLETEALARHFVNQRYDYVVCADVLEHLRHPEAVIAQLAALLKPSGRIMISIPNVAYAGVIGALINGEFRYRESGLLDETHLRFYTRKSLLGWLASSGLRVTRIDTVAMPINDSEFADDHLEGLPPAVLRTLMALPDAMTYQFIVEAAPAGGDITAAIIEHSHAASFTYMAQLFFRSNQHFDEAHSTVLHAKLGVDRQRLRFSIPASARDMVALRLDPANRPGYLRLHDMALFDADHDCVWRWDPTAPLEHVASNQLHFLHDAGAGVLLVLEGDDPWFELPLSAEPLSRMRGGGILEIDVAWPQAPDSHAVIKRLLGREGQLQRIVDLEAIGGALRGELDQLKCAKAELNTAHEQLRARHESLTGAMRAHIHTLGNELATMQVELRAALARLAEIDGSIAFRLARPLVKLVNRLRRSP